MGVVCLSLGKVLSKEYIDNIFKIQRFADESVRLHLTEGFCIKEDIQGYLVHKISRLNITDLVIENPESSISNFYVFLYNFFESQGVNLGVRYVCLKRFFLPNTFARGLCVWLEPTIQSLYSISLVDVGLGDISGIKYT